MRGNLRNAGPLIHITIQHPSDQINTILRNHKRHAQIMVHDLVNAVEGVLLVEDGVEQDTEGPDVLFEAVVGRAGEDFGRCVVWSC